MKTFKEFIEDLSKDETFAKEINEAVQAKRESGATSYQEAVVPVAAEYGYEFSQDELEEFYESQTAEMSEEELGRVAGGTACVTWFIVVSGLSIASASASISYITHEY